MEVQCYTLRMSSYSKDEQIELSYLIEEGVRLFIKVAASNLYPFLWLFYVQSLFNIHFDGPLFWSIYLLYSLLITFGVWFTNKELPNPGADKDYRTPVYGLVVAMFQPLVFILILVAYKATHG